MDPLVDGDATALAELVRKKEVTPLELVEAAIRRIEAVEPRLNTLVSRFFDEARAACPHLPVGPFTGVPFLVKDIVAEVAGAKTFCGSRFVNWTSARDSELVARHRRAGLVILGKTQTPELGIVPTTEPVRFGPCRNPWDPMRTTGGSSGGAAAAVAARVVPMAHANDGGGSIRIPASCCGVFGLKPTRGRNPLGPNLGDIMGGLVVEHAVTRSVRDSAALLDATCGPDLGAPYAAAAPSRPYREEVGVDPGRLRVGVSMTSPIGVPTHPDCVAAVLETARLLEQLGHVVEETTPNLEVATLMQAFMVVWAAGVAANVDGWALLQGRPPSDGELEPFTVALAELGRKATASDYLLATAALQKASRELQAQTVDYQAVLTPTLAEPPLPLGALDAPADNPMEAFFRSAAFAPFTAMANVTGQPAMSVPLAWNGAGLPIGVQLIGRYGDEATLFRLAAQLEAERPWAGRRPAIAA